MKIDFEKYQVYTNWRDLLWAQYHERCDEEFDSFIEWAENEWHCKLEIFISGLNHQKQITGMRFTKEDYLLAILKFGPPGKN